MSLLTRKQRKVEWKITARKLTTQGMMKVRRIMSLHNGQVGLTQSEKCYSMDESDKTWFVFQSDSEEEEFMVLIEFANS